MSVNELFNQGLKIINVGLISFKDSLEEEGFQVIQVDWRPPVVDEEALDAIDKILLMQAKGKIDIERANQEAFTRLISAKPKLVGMEKAIDVIPGMKRNMLLHAGPPITWERMCGPMKGAVIGALIYEDFAKDEEQAEEIALSGEIEFSPCHYHNAVGPMAGIISPSMSVYVVENETYGNKSFSAMNDEGFVKSLRMGAYSPDVIERLKWMEKVFYPALDRAIRFLGSVDLKNIIAQALHMGDEVHSRHKGATSLFFRAISPAIVRTTSDPIEVENVLKSIDKNDFTFLNIAMAAAKASLDAARNINASTMVVAMARSGTEFGLQVSGLGDDWFTVPSEVPRNALYFTGFTREDANPDIGDSSITETAGLGGFAIAAAPTFIQFTGGTPQDAVNKTLMMYEITIGENNVYQLPILNFRGTPTGIDVKRVVEKGIIPYIDTAIAYKKPGVGIIGAGLADAPMEAFKKAMIAFVKKYS